MPRNSNLQNLSPVQKSGGHGATLVKQNTKTNINQTGQTNTGINLTNSPHSNVNSESNINNNANVNSNVNNPTRYSGPSSPSNVTQYSKTMVNQAAQNN